MRKVLDIINPEGELRDELLKTKDNFQTLGEIVNLLGVNILASLSLAVSQSITSTSFVKVNNHQASVSTSGGIVAYIAQISSSMTEGDDAFFEIRVDDVSKSLVSTGLGAGGVTRLVGSSTLLWIGSLPAGTHTFKLYAKVTAGTLGVSPLLSTNQTKTDAYILEFLRG